MARIWLVVGDKLGDNAQVAALAAELALPAEWRELRFQPPYVLGKPRFAPSLGHLDPARSAPLEPPWPDLVVTIGRRAAMAALWVKRQSGGRTRLVLIGRPRRFADEFDLVLVTGQYRVPARPNLVHLDLPLMRPDPERVAAAGAAWRARLDALPRPLTALFVGGPTKPFRFDGAVAQRLLAEIARTIAPDRGSLYVTTSRRTPESVADALDAALPPDAALFRWTADAADNPYLALLAAADRFVVTGDSVSMMVEAAQTGRPLAIRPLPVSGGLAAVRAALLRLLHGDGATNAPLQRLGDLLFRLGWAGYSRDFARFHALMVARGYASLLADGFRVPTGDPRAEAARAAAAVRRLLVPPAQ